MLNRLILKFTKFQLPPPKRLSTLVKGEHFGWEAIMPPSPCQIGVIMSTTFLSKLVTVELGLFFESIIKLYFNRRVIKIF